VKGHGSHVDGILLGLSPQSGAIPNPGAVRIELLNVKVTDDSDDQADLFKATCGIYYAIEQGAKVLNLSWGYYTRTPPKNSIMLDALQQAKNKGVIIVAALGNGDATLSDTCQFWPACFAADWDNVISVASSTNGERSSFSNQSASSTGMMTTAAPGESIISTVPPTIRVRTPTGWETRPTNGFALASGTSMAAPYVSRSIALMMGNKMPVPSDLALVKNHVAVTKTTATSGWATFQAAAAVNPAALPW
jgi:subtilisin family serine protease